MELTDEQCKVILQEAFKDSVIPSCTVEDVNRVLIQCQKNVIKVVELRFTTDKQFPEISDMMGYSENYAYELYKRFIHRLQYAPKVNWFRQSSGKFAKDTPIALLGLSPRACNCLRRRGISTIGDIYEILPIGLDSVRGLGEVTIKEIKGKLNEISIND